MKVDPRLKDKQWRISHLYYIRDKNGNKIQFKPNRAQLDFMGKAHTRNIILKSRQLGFTTLESVDMLDDVLFSKNFDAIQIAHTQDIAKNLFRSKIQFAWNSFPLAELYQTSTDKANEIKFDFGDKTYSSILVANSGRSGTYQRVHISEFAKLVKNFPGKADEVLTGTIPSVPHHGRIDIESTAEGEFGEFHDMFWEAYNRGKPTLSTEFKAHFYNWTWDDNEIEKVTEREIEYAEINPEYKTFRKKKRSIYNKVTKKQFVYYFMTWLSLSKSYSKLSQEFPFTEVEAFQASGHKHFDKDALAEMKLEEGKKEGDWTIFEDYMTDGTYMMGADVSEGVGQDSSTAVVLKQNEKTLKVVATYNNNLIAPDIFAHELKRMGLRYGTALICPERNNHGHTTISKLKEIYPNIYKEVDKRKDFEVRKTGVKIKKYGWLTTLVTKPLMLSELKEAITNKLIEIPSKELVYELRTYDREDLSSVKFDEKATKHWDLVMACFVKDTKILTSKGQKSIEKIKVGDLVLTRKGYKRVKKTLTRKKEVVTRMGLTGTPNHPIIVGKGTKELIRVRKSDIITIWNTQKKKIEKLPLIKALNIIETKTLEKEIKGSTFWVRQSGKKVMAYIFTEEFILIISEKFQKVLSFIILMETHVTMKLKILLHYLYQTILSYTWLKKKEDYNQKTTLTKIEKKSTKELKLITKIKPLQKKSVVFVEKFFTQKRIMRSIAQKNAGEQRKTRKGETKNNKSFAVFVKILFGQVFHIKKDVQQSVLKSEDKKNIRTVYNLEIEDTPEYFANNILVHNCAIAFQLRTKVVAKIGIQKISEQEVYSLPPLDFS